MRAVPECGVKTKPAARGDGFLNRNLPLAFTNFCLCAIMSVRREGGAEATYCEVINMPKKVLKPGTPAPASGQYQNVKTKTEVTSVKGEPLPPTPRPNQGYILVDKTKHKGK